MSDFFVDESEVEENRFSERDIERLLSGETPNEEKLARLAPLVDGLRARHAHTPSEEKVALFASKAVEVANSTRPGGNGQPHPDKSVNRSRMLKRRFATAFAAAVLLAGMTGIAVASDDAAPGDALYGLDRALEVVNLGNGGPAERIAEAQSLFNEGLVAEAIEHAAEAAEEAEEAADAEDFSPENSKAAEALMGAAESVLSGGAEQSDDVHEAVAEMLESMAYWLEHGVDDGTFGQNVSEMARGIAGKDNASDAAQDAVDKAAEEAEGAEEGEDAGPPEGVPGGPPEGIPGGPPERAPGAP